MKKNKQPEFPESIFVIINDDDLVLHVNGTDGDEDFNGKFGAEYTLVRIGKIKVETPRAKMKVSLEGDV